MVVCDYCGVEIEGPPLRRKKHVYCSKTCLEEHEFEISDVDEEDPEYELEDADEDEEEER